MDNIREIVNGSQLNGFLNRKGADNEIIKISLKRPLDKPLEGYVEVHGTSTGKGVMADEFIIFNNSSFDAKAHNTLCALLYTVPNIWNIM